MLGGRISNHDEDEVQDELDALDAELSAVPLPEAPKTELPKERARTSHLEREREREGEEQREAILA